MDGTTIRGKPSALPVSRAIRHPDPKRPAAGEPDLASLLRSCWYREADRTPETADAPRDAIWFRRKKSAAP
jgi:hypothetical protein